MWILQSHEGTEEAALILRLSPGSVKTVGRAPVADYVVDASLVSRLHCRLTAVSDKVLQVDDLDSTNGTFVNGRRVSTAHLTEGDTLDIGRVSLTVSKNTG